MRRVSTLAVLVAWSFVLLSGAPICAQLTGSVEALNEAVGLLKLNRDRIQTWEGQAVIVRNTIIKKRPLVATGVIDFSYQADGNRLRFSGKEQRTIGGEPQAWAWGGIRDVDSYLHVTRHRIDDADGFDAHTKLFVKEELSKETPSYWGDDFDPFYYVRMNGRDPREFLSFLYENRQQITPEVTVQLNGTVVSFRNGGAAMEWNHLFDLKQAGQPVLFQHSTRASPQEEWKLEAETKLHYMEVDGVWLPRLIEINDPAGQMEIVWSDHRLNEPIDPAKFTMESFNLLPGNFILDSRSGEQTQVDKPEFLEKYRERLAVKPTERNDRQSESRSPTLPLATTSRRSMWWMLLGVNLVAAVAVVAWAIFRRRTA